MIYNPMQNIGYSAYGQSNPAALQSRMAMRQDLLAQQAFMPICQPSPEEMMGLQGFYNGCLGNINQLRYGCQFPDLSLMMMQDPQMMMFMMLYQQMQMQNMMLMMLLMNQQSGIGGNIISQMLSGNGGTGAQIYNNPNWGGITGTSASGNAAVDMAKKFLGRDSISIKGQMPHFTAAGGVTNNCADFVSSCLEGAGLLKGHEINVGRLEDSLKKQGYRQVPQDQAQPGDVWISASGGHTELVAEAGGRTLIGSNGSSYQRISEDHKSGQRGGRFYHKFA